MNSLLRRFCCWLRGHHFVWERNHFIGKPDALECSRCGHREENGLRWCLEQLTGGEP